MSDEIPLVTFIDNPHAPVVFASDASGYFLLEDVISITLEAGRVDHSRSPGPINRVVVARLAMPVAAAQRLALGLYDFLKQRGLDPMAVVKDGQPVQ